MNLATQSSASSADEIRELGRAFQSLIVWGKKLPLLTSVLAMGVWNAIECWFLQCLVLGIWSFVGTLAFPLRPLYCNISLLSFLLFLRESHFNCPRMPVVNYRYRPKYYTNETMMWLSENNQSNFLCDQIAHRYLPQSITIKPDCLWLGNKQGTQP